MMFSQVIQNHKKKGENNAKFQKKNGTRTLEGIKSNMYLKCILFVFSFKLS